MYIGKPYRFLGALAGACAVGALLIWKWSGAGGWGAIAGPVAGFLVGWCVFARAIGAFDMWLRRKTKDELWLQSGEGKEWKDRSEFK